MTDLKYFGFDLFIKSSFVDMKFIFFQNLQFLVGHELLIDIKGLVGFFTARYIFMLTNSYLLRLSAT